MMNIRFSVPATLVAACFTAAAMPTSARAQATAQTDPAAVLRPADLSKVTTLSECAKAVDAAGRARMMATRDPALKDKPSQADLSRLAAEDVKACVDRFPNPQGADLLVLADLQAMGGDMSSALNTVRSRLSDANLAVPDRVATLSKAIQFASRSPGGSAFVEMYVGELEKLGEPAQQAYLAAVGSLFNRARTPEQRAKYIPKATQVIAMIQQMPQAKRDSLVSQLAGPYQFLIDSYLADNKVSEAHAVLTGFEKDFATVPANKLNAQSRSLRYPIGRKELIGKPAQAIQAESWLAATGEAKPVAFGNGKVTMIQLTAHWCGPCRASYPKIAEWQNQYKDQGYQTVFVTRTYGYFKDQQGLSAADEVAADKKYFLEEHALPISVAVLHAPGKGEASATFVDPNSEFYNCNAIPQFVLVDRDGIIRDVVVGFSADNQTRLESTLRQLLSDGKQSASAQ